MIGRECVHVTLNERAPFASVTTLNVSWPPVWPISLKSSPTPSASISVAAGLYSRKRLDLMRRVSRVFLPSAISLASMRVFRVQLLIYFASGFSSSAAFNCWKPASGLRPFAVGRFAPFPVVNWQWPVVSKRTSANALKWVQHMNRASGYTAQGTGWLMIFIDDSVDPEKRIIQSPRFC
jgi:hypothetical protein